MMVGMVDNTDWWRPRTSAPVMQPDTRSPLARGVDALNESFRQSGVGNYLPSPTQLLAQLGSLVLPSTAAATQGQRQEPMLARQVKQQTPLPFGEDVAGYAAGGALGAGLGAGARLAAPYVTQAVGAAGTAVNAAVKPALRAGALYDNLIDVDIDPATTARMLALTDRLFHGKQGTKNGRLANDVAPRSFDVLPESPSRFSNWFEADFFTTPSQELASTYGDAYKISGLSNNLRVLDLMPGGRSIAEQNPGLARALERVFGPEQAPEMVTRHKPYTEQVLANINDPLAKGSFSDILSQYGYNALRHVSGQGAGGGKSIAEPVYAFLRPQGMTATATVPTNQSVLDSAASALFRQNMDTLPKSLQNFVVSRRQGLNYGLDNVGNSLAPRPYISSDKIKNLLKPYFDRIFPQRIVDNLDDL